MSRDGWKRKVRANYFTESPEETIRLGEQLALDLKPGTIIALKGDLGAGKTTLIKGIAAHCPNVIINSPTFTYLQIYSGTPPIFHFDLYRLKGEQEFLEKGFSDYFDQSGICCIEWPERIERLLPQNTLWISIEHLGEGRRKIGIN